MSAERSAALALLALSIGYGLLTLQIEVVAVGFDGGFDARTLPLLLSISGVLLSLTLLLRATGTDDSHGASDSDIRRDIRENYSERGQKCPRLSEKAHSDRKGAGAISGDGTRVSDRSRHSSAISPGGSIPPASICKSL